MKENLNFLDHICGDGYTPVSFLKMMPFLDTKIKKDLEKEGRLNGEPGFLDYDFFDKSMNDFFEFIADVLDTWINAPNGLLNVAKWADIYLKVFRFYNGEIRGIQSLSDRLTALLVDVNRYLIETIRTLSVKFESGDYQLENDEELEDFRNSIEEKHNSAKLDIIKIAEKVELLNLTKAVFL